MGSLHLFSRKLAASRQLRDLVVHADDVAVVEAVLRRLRAVTSIRAVTLCACRAATSGPSLANAAPAPVLLALRKRLTKLEVHADLSPACWQRIAKLASLRHLSVEWYQLVHPTDAGDQDQHGAQLELWPTSRTESHEIVRRLRKMPHLARFSIAKGHLCPAGVARLTGLTYLDVQRVHTRWQDLPVALQACPRLAALQLGHGTIGRNLLLDGQLASLPPLPALGAYIGTDNSMSRRMLQHCRVCQPCRSSG
jgi:hypothetical protein